ncbi:hypothetical protein CHUAL_002612 [Chamberlinius hualienensis]
MTENVPQYPIVDSPPQASRLLESLSIGRQEAHEYHCLSSANLDPSLLNMMELQPPPPHPADEPKKKHQDGTIELRKFQYIRE